MGRKQRMWVNNLAKWTKNQLSSVRNQQKSMECNTHHYYYYIYSYFKYINPTQVLCKQTWQKVHKTPKNCINYEAGCAQVINNVTELLAREKQGRQEYYPSLIAIKSDKESAQIFWMSDKPLKWQHLNEKYLICSRLLIYSDNDHWSQQSKAFVPKNDLYLPNITQ